MAMLELDMVSKYNFVMLLRLDSHLRNPGILDPSSRHKPLNVTLRPLQLKTKLLLSTLTLSLQSHQGPKTASRPFPEGFKVQPKPDEL